MFQEMLAMGSGGSKHITLLADTTQLLGSITTAGGSFTAPEDCIMFIAKIIATSATEAYIYYEQDDVADILMRAYNTNGNSFYMTNACGVFIPKGATISTKNGTGNQYSINFYKMAT